MVSGPVLVSRAWERHARLAFDAYQPMDNYISEFIVTANADGLTATVPVITTQDGHGLPAFVRGLAEHFRGWEGTRSWRSLENQLRVEATWHAGGHVALLFRVKPSVYDKWAVDVEFTVEAGEELRRLGEGFSDFMEG